MNQTAVLYQSTYGTTKSYAEQIARDLGASLMECKRANIAGLAEYDTIILGGGIYAGRIAGSELFRKNAEKLISKHLVVFSVGFTPQARVDILDQVKVNSFETDQLKNIDFFHFRGSIDYRKLHLYHRLLLWAKRLQISMQPENKRTEDNKRFLKRYGKNIDFSLDSTQALIETVKGMHSI